MEEEEKEKKIHKETEKDRKGRGGVGGSGAGSVSEQPRVRSGLELNLPSASPCHRSQEAKVNLH